jgi:hypothetical protein
VPTENIKDFKTSTDKCLSSTFFSATIMSDARSQLLAVLVEAASQDYTRMKQAEELLKQWETERSFFATLQV